MITFLAFGEPHVTQQDTKNGGNFKRTVGGRGVVGENLARLIRQATMTKFSFQIGQYAVLYLHPTGRRNDKLVYLNPNVDAFMRNQALRFTQDQGPDLDAMLGFTVANTGNQCPSHIVIYTLNAPCFLPGRDPTGCTELIFRAFDRVKSFTCRGTKTKYVLGYRYDPGREDVRQNWTKGKRYLEVMGITVVRINL